MGGVGKSPMVAHLAVRFQQAGRNPAILTRGYKRKSAEPLVLVRRGEHASLDLTGDEAQIFLREGAAHIGIGGHRYAVGQQMERHFAPGVFLLDDGFQHRKLARQHDIVLIDGLNPFGGGVFPLGRSREPAEGLARATAIVVSRAEPGQHNTGLERQLRQYNRTAPIFRCRVVPREWVDVHSTLAVACRATGVYKSGCLLRTGQSALVLEYSRRIEIGLGVSLGVRGSSFVFAHRAAARSGAGEVVRCGGHRHHREGRFESVRRGF